MRPDARARAFHAECKSQHRFRVSHSILKGTSFHIGITLTVSYRLSVLFTACLRLGLRAVLVLLLTFCRRSLPSLAPCFGSSSQFHHHCVNFLDMLASATEGLLRSLGQYAASTSISVGFKQAVCAAPFGARRWFSRTDLGQVVAKVRCPCPSMALHNLASWRADPSAALTGGRSLGARCRAHGGRDAAASVGGNDRRVDADPREPARPGRRPCQRYPQQHHHHAHKHEGWASILIRLRGPGMVPPPTCWQCTRPQGAR